MHDFCVIVPFGSLESSRDASDVLQLPSRPDASLSWISSGTMMLWGCLKMALFFCARFPGKVLEYVLCFW
jgi:hypothetical protein